MYNSQLIQCRKLFQRPNGRFFSPEITLLSSEFTGVEAVDYSVALPFWDKILSEPVNSLDSTHSTTL